MQYSQLILAFETSGKAGSVALARFQGDQPQGQPIECATEILDANVGSAKTLAPAIDRLLRRSQHVPKELDAIALTSGPGSFTGLRVGIATAKAMSYALKIPIVELDTLQIIAEQITDSFSELHVIMDAYRGQLFHAKFYSNDSALKHFESGTQTRIVDISAFLSEISCLKNVTLCGPGTERVRKFLTENETAAMELGTIDSWRWLDGPSAHPLAETVARLGWRKLQQREVSDAFAITPKYYRGSAAEEKRRINEK